MASLIKQITDFFHPAPTAPPATVPTYPLTDRPLHVVYSFVVDAAAQFAYQGYHLAQSLIQHAVADAADIHVQFTPAVPESTRDVFRSLGCTLHEIQPFGDGRFCNKLAQLDHLLDSPCDRIVLLDTDTLLVGDPRPQLGPDSVLGKIVDYANPPLPTLQEIAAAAGLGTLPASISTDTGDAPTYPGNYNGGFYSIPCQYARTISAHWRKWAGWVQQNMEPLRKAKKENHIDQVAMWLTLQTQTIPFQPCRANLNYFLHRDAHHRYFDPALPITLLHYHGKCLSVTGLIEPTAKMHGPVAEAVDKANAQISSHFHNRLFWDLRYQKFPERGSGVGSMGKNLLLKRQWLQSEGIESAAGVLDVGCGNLEVIKSFNPKNYLGLDQSEQALATARAARPDWNFRAINVTQEGDSIPPAELVICFEVLIHQETADAYHRFIRFLADKTQKKLIVSGYEELAPRKSGKHMLFFYEPLRQSLHNTGKFRLVEPIGEHTGVTVFRCVV